MTSEEISFNVSQHPLHTFPRNSFWHALHHFAHSPEICERLYLDPSPAGQEDIEIASRLLASYHAMVSNESKHIAPIDQPHSGIWEMVKHEFHGEFYRLMAEGDITGFASFMRNGLRTGLGYGLGTGPGAFKAMSVAGEAREASVLLLLDRLASLAEAIGALPHENPEQGRYGENIAISATELVDRIESTVGARIGRPPVIGEFGLFVDGQIIDPRVPDDVYTSWRMREIASTFGLSNFCEIGGGLGGTALQTIRLARIFHGCPEIQFFQQAVDVQSRWQSNCVPDEAVSWILGVVPPTPGLDNVPGVHLLQAIQKQNDWQRAGIPRGGRMNWQRRSGCGAYCG